MNFIHPDDSRTLRYGDGPVGVVVSHGFTGTTNSVRAWAEAFAGRGDTTVIAPRLAGHGTCWEDLAPVNWEEWLWDVRAAYLEIAHRCEQVFVAGLSMGGALALRLAQLEPVAGVLLVNPAIASSNPALKGAGALHKVVASQPGIASDIAMPGVVEPGYPRLSVRAAWQMTQLWGAVRAGLGSISQPVLLMKSRVDHVVDEVTQSLLRDNLPQLEEVALTRSFHVATMDYDLDVIVRESSAFIDRVRG